MGAQPPGCPSASASAFLGASYSANLQRFGGPGKVAELAREVWINTPSPAFVG
jgi:hypothetical protein